MSEERKKKNESNNITSLFFNDAAKNAKSLYKNKHTNAYHTPWIVGMFSTAVTSLVSSGAILYSDKFNDAIEDKSPEERAGYSALAAVTTTFLITSIHTAILYVNRLIVDKRHESAMTEHVIDYLNKITKKDVKDFIKNSKSTNLEIWNGNIEAAADDIFNNFQGKVKEFKNTFQATEATPLLSVNKV